MQHLITGGSSFKIDFQVIPLAGREHIHRRVVETTLVLPTYRRAEFQHIHGIASPQADLPHAGSFLLGLSGQG